MDVMPRSSRLPGRVCLLHPLLATSALTLLAASMIALAPARPAPAASGATSDYAAEAFSDPWDYSNPEDQVIADDGPTRSMTNAAISGGQLHFDMAGQGYFHPLWGGYPGALPIGREGAAHPIDASRFNTIAFRMNANAEVPAGVRWYTCQEISDACQGGFNFFTVPGWHTYMFPLQAINEPALTAPWSGNIVSLRIALSPGGQQHFDVDWVRVMPSGVEANDDFGPVPQVDQPDVTGGADYASTARAGDAWDFNEASDYLRADNVAGGVSGGQFVGQNAAPALNDPSVTMRLGPTFSGDQFHRVTVGYTYDGGFNLQDKVGGGMTARLIWRIAGTPLTKTGADLQNSDDIVTYPNAREFTVDLASNPASAVTDPDQNGPRVGWSGQMIEMLRIDPNEDRGARSWRLDYVKVADDDAGAKSFDIVWHDNAWKPGTKADLFVDNDDKGFDGTPIATGLDVSQGRNVYTWTPPAGTPGRWYVYAVHSHNGRTGRAYSTGPVRIGGITDPAAYTFGAMVGGPSSQAGAGGPANTVPSQLALSSRTRPGGKAVKAGTKAMAKASAPKAPLAAVVAAPAKAA